MENKYYYGNDKLLDSFYNDAIAKTIKEISLM